MAENAELAELYSELTRLHVEIVALDALGLARAESEHLARVRIERRIEQLRTRIRRAA